MKSYTELLADAKSKVTEITPDAARKLHDEKQWTFLDVRDQQEVNLGKVPGAVHISRGTLESKVEAQIPRDTPVVIYCAGGNRSAFAADVMQQMGYTKVVSMIDGFRGWAQAGGEVEG